MSVEKSKFTVGDPDKDFFEQNPHWKYLDSSVKLFGHFDRETISKVRWAIYMIEDPDSKFFRYPKERRVELVNNNYLKDTYTINYDPEKMKIVNEELEYALNVYARETMSKLKQDYYERELSYQILVGQERDATDLKLKADVQVKLAKIYDELNKAREAFEAENEEEKTKARGRQQPGMLFKNK